MNIVERVKKICLSPATEWPVIAAETTPTGDLVTGYVLPLAGISAVAGFIGGSLVGQRLPFLGMVRTPIVSGLVFACFSVVMAVVAVFVISAIINALAPNFGAEKNDAQAFKVAVYSFTPAWVAGVLNIVPALGVLAVLGGLYGMYILYLGLPRLMKCPEDKAVGYAAVVIVCTIVVMAVVGVVGGAIVGTGALGSGAFGGGLGGSQVELDADSPAGQLQQLGRALEQSADRIQDAQARGDRDAQAAAAVEGLGALIGGGSRVEPIALEQIQAFVPETFAGLPRTTTSAERNGVGGFTIARAEATYGDADRRVTLEVLDTGGMGGLMGMAAWMGLQGEREDEDEIERTSRVGDRVIHERVSKVGGTNEFAVILASRFMVSAEGGLDAGALKSAVSSLDLDGLESLKSAGTEQP